MNQESSAAPETSRRSALVAAAAVFVGAATMLAPLGAALGVALDPLLRRRRGGSRWIRVAQAAAVPADGAPTSFQLVSDRQDAWTRYQAQPVGAVYLRRDAEGKISALTAECPHAGCFVPFDGEKFACPCHNSTFAPNGERLDPETCVSPRSMDPLPIDQEKLAAGEVWVELKSFQKGVAERIEIH